MIRNTITKINKELIKKQLAFIPGKIYRESLVYLGATENDLTALEEGSIHAAMERDPEPAWHYRQLGCQRNLLIQEEKNDDDTFSHRSQEGKHRIREAGCAAAYRFYQEEQVFHRPFPYWPLPPKQYSDSSVPFATTRLMEMFIPDTFTDEIRTNTASKCVIHDQLMIRINKTSEDNSASPTPEGIHQDGAQITSITLVGLHNVTQLGENRLWPMSTPIGNYEDGMFEANEGPFSKNTCLFNQTLSNPWDTLIFNDRKVKHEARQFYGPCGAYRDIIANDLRKPFSDGLDAMIDENGKNVSIE